MYKIFNVKEKFKKITMAKKPGDSNSSEHDTLVEQWKIKNLIKHLSQARGNGTSVISLVIPKDQISRVQKMLQDEHGTTPNIISRVNRLSVLSAITSARERLKLYNKVPKNGSVVYCGTVMTDDGKEKNINNFEPFKPINTSLYLYDNKFHVEPLNELLESDTTFGFIIMDSNGLRFVRLRMEKRHNYVRKCAETATRHSITNDLPNVKGLVLAGSANFKNYLFNSDILECRLKAIVIKIVDTYYGLSKDASMDYINLI
ncbi:eukaryotic release factor 1 [Reticulomyxa filosa]|uniref:Eukaryotic release factor 1 n=1 Tax=Reticulomyxa filosa TaxID=46433 RepID=X6P1X8_RETFI|nr:eukaryotic release factor 1 [Reticulomyxa filosa]|eukprot:ETO32143.1 eukaryotic release factor 1 [Reticulomyxa filosa]